MKAISLWQPWASLMVAGKKRVETRHWPLKHRGPLLIHAAKKWDQRLANLCLTKPFRESLAAFGVPPSPHSFSTASSDAMKAGWSMPFGAIIGRVNVVDCYRTEDVDFDSAGLDVQPSDPVWRYKPGKLRLWPDPEQAFGDYSSGRFAFLCENAVTFDKPIPYRGLQGLFDVPEIKG